MDNKDVLVMRLKKKINTLININQEVPLAVDITAAEAKILDGISEINNVKLIVKEETKMKNDCKFYNSKSKDCNALVELVCTYKKCKLYNTTIDLEAIEKDIKEYTKRMKENGKEKTTDRNESKDQ